MTSKQAMELEWAKYMRDYPHGTHGAAAKGFFAMGWRLREKTLKRQRKIVVVK